MQAEQPLVSVVLAVFRPNPDWLRELLFSLNRQTYRPLELLIRDDCPDCPTDPEIFRECVTAFPWQLVKGQKNLGSNGAFQELTSMARGKYIAYCDQDDIWEDWKIARMVRRLEETGALLCCSDLSVIDEAGRELAPSITRLRRRHVFREGAGLAPGLIYRNFVTGCAMVMRAEMAKAAIPFEPYMVHDHWLALFSAVQGEIAFEPAATVRYRQHGGNQTGVLTGVRTKEDYSRLRIELFLSRVRSLSERLGSREELRGPLEESVRWARAREDYYRHPDPASAARLWADRQADRSVTLFELFMPMIPAFLFGRILNLLK
ncbi:glycosyltransferase [Papillibacter cinnamivorans]|uniref:Glycosyltransferase involved in cell wall bisynthesis n=1 Tax=Papillibacter cinnamivorans DSM 12816 TaxID=1122930 RepID=A0A1W2BKL2_9FIRM|nr:glycosyltransferase [Papillibacter cinnamivorans]SMC73404.1 Glycosyltransferase involved in cell wall bisynthesis [Papillibacter cinnamivorans DSM 12816]